MNILSKTIAALVTAFILVATPSFAVEYKTLDGGKKVYDCRPTGNSFGYKIEVLIEYSDEEIRGLAAAGLKPTSKKYWAPVTTEKCEDLIIPPGTLRLGGFPLWYGRNEFYPKGTLDFYFCARGLVFSHRLINVNGALKGNVEQVKGKNCVVDETMNLKPVMLLGSKPSHSELNNLIKNWPYPKKDHFKVYFCEKSSVAIIFVNKNTLSETRQEIVDDKMVCAPSNNINPLSKDFLDKVNSFIN